MNYYHLTVCSLWYVCTVSNSVCAYYEHVAVLCMYVYLRTYLFCRHSGEFEPNELPIQVDSRAFKEV